QESTRAGDKQAAFICVRSRQRLCRGIASIDRERSARYMGRFVRSKVENSRSHVFRGGKAMLGDGSHDRFFESLWIGLIRQPCIKQWSLGQTRGHSVY